jgi:hypothetical protein
MTRDLNSPPDGHLVIDPDGGVEFGSLDAEWAPNVGISRDVCHDHIKDAQGFGDELSAAASKWVVRPFWLAAPPPPAADTSAKVEELMQLATDYASAKSTADRSMELCSYQDRDEARAALLAALEAALGVGK